MEMIKILRACYSNLKCLFQKRIPKWIWKKMNSQNRIPKTDPQNFQEWTPEKWKIRLSALTAPEACLQTACVPADTANVPIGSIVLSELSARRAWIRKALNCCAPMPDTVTENNHTIYNTIVIYDNL